MAKIPTFLRTTWPFSLLADTERATNHGHRRIRSRRRRPFERLEDRSLLAVAVTPNTDDFLADDPDIVIVGTDFSEIVTENVVAFKDSGGNVVVTGTVVAATPTALTVEFDGPLEAGDLFAEVIVNSVSSGADVQVANVIPVVTLGTTPVAANASAFEITIEGTGFDTTFGNNSVTFNNGFSGTVTASTATTLTVEVTGSAPSEAGDLIATVTTNGNVGAPVKVANVRPVVTLAATAALATDNTITIAGFGFDPVAANNSVVFSNGAIGTVQAGGLTTTSMTVSFASGTKPSAGDLTAIVTSNGIVSGSAIKVAEISPVATLSAASLGANSAQMTIAGVGFSSIANQNSVTFNNGAQGTVVASTATSLTVAFTTRPTVFGDLEATVTTRGIAAAAAVQVATIVPTVTANPSLRSPVNATSIVINGFGFDGSAAANNEVEFDNGAVGTVSATNLSTTSLTVTITVPPTVAGPLNARVRIAGGSYGAFAQVASVTPVVSSNTGNNLPADANELIILGSGFSTTASNNTVAFSSGAVGRITTATATRLTVAFDDPNDVRPVGGPLTAVVTTNGVNNGSAVQVARVRPVVTSNTDPLAANATTLTIAGTGFDPTAANNTVTFNNGAQGTVTAATKTSLTVTITARPTLSGNLRANVTVNGVTSTAVTTVANVTPVVTSGTTSIAIDNDEVTVNGFGFGTVAGNNVITFNNGAVGTVTNATATALTVTLSQQPTVAGPLQVASLTSNGVVSGTTNVPVAIVRPLVTANTVYQISADGNSVIINGQGFSTTASENIVTFNNGAVGTVSATGLTATSMTVDFSTKPTSAGDLEATVTTLDASSSAPVVVATVAPVVTPSATVLDINADTLTIAGFGFDPVAANNTVVLSNGATGDVTAATPTSLTVTFDVKPTSVGTLTAVVTSNLISSGTAVGVASVLPSVTESSTALAINAAEIVITGVGFSATPSNNTVVFNNGAVGTVTGVNLARTELTVALTVKPSAVGDLTAQVFVTGTSTGTTATKVATVVPVVTTASTSLAANGTLEINGFGFSTTLANNTIEFSSGIGTVTAATPIKLTVSFSPSTVGNTPPTAGDLTALVTVGTIPAVTAPKVAEVKPVVTSGSQSLAADATTLTINGYGFLTGTPGDNTVAFDVGSGAAGTVTAATATTLTVTLSSAPTKAGVVTAIVTAAGGNSGEAVQVATAAPAVTTSSTNLGINTTSIQIAGTRFDTTAANNTVVFNNGAVGTVRTATATLLTVDFTSQPTSVGDLTAVVTTNGQSSGTAVKVASVIPVVTTSSLTLAANGTLTINGFGFDGTTEANNVVTLSSGTGTVTASTATSLTVTFDTLPSAGMLTATVEVGDPSSVDPLPTSASATVATVRPVVTSSPSDLAAGAETLTINGFGFDATTPGDNVVTFNNGLTGHTVTAATATSLTVTFGSNKPSVVGNLTAIVTTDGVASGSATQVATVKPTITSSTAELGINASTITINGFGFGSTIATNQVTFNNGAVGNVTAASPTQLTVTFTTKPTGLGALTATVTANSVVGTANVPVATVSPVVTPRTTDLLATANTIVINGFGFDSTPGNNTVTFNNGAVGAVTSATTTSLTVTFTTKPEAGDLTASVTVGGVSNAPVQVATVKPIITSSTANLAANATSIVINGFGFDTTAANNTVDFGDGPVTATAATATTLTVPISSPLTTAGSLTAIVTTNGEASGLTGVQVATVVPGVTVSSASLSLTSNTIVINGAGFDGTTALNNVVTFNNGAEGVVQSASATQLTVAFNSGKRPAAGQLTAVVTTNGASSGTPVRVANVVPIVTASTTTTLAADATSVIINGSGFSTTRLNNTVVFSSGAVGTVQSATSTRLTVTLTTRPIAGVLTARVTVNGVQSAAAVQVATVNPKVTSSSTRIGLNGTSLLIRGFGFDPVAARNRVVFTGAGGATGTVTAATENSLTVTFASNGRPTTAGDLSAVVTTNSRNSGTAVKVATVAEAITTPIVVTSNASNRAANASTTLTIAGSGFSTVPGNNVVTFNNGAVGTVTASTATSLTVTFTTLPKAGNLTARVAVNGVLTGSAVQVASIIPVVTSSTADLLANSTALTINGFGFDPVATNNRVTLSNGAVGRVTAATPTSLTLQLTTRPTSLGNITATVTTNTKASSSIQVATVKPTVTTRTTAIGIAAPTMTINGSGFSATPGSNVVTFNNGATGTVTSVNSARTQLTVTFDTPPSALGELTASVTIGSLNSGTAVQVGVVAPMVTAAASSISPSASSITITGEGFSTTAANNVVTFNNGAAGVVTAATATELTVAFSSKPAAGDLTAIVTTSGFSSGTAVKIAEVAMSVTLSTATLAANSSTVTINGTGFSTTPASNVVTLNNGATGTVTAATPTSLTFTFTSQPFAGNLTATVTTNGESSGSPVQVATVVPVITSSTFDMGINGTRLVINGFGFDPTFGNNTAVLSDGVGTAIAATKNSLTLNITTPPAELGSVTAVVTTNSQSSGAPVQVANVVAAVTAPTVTSSSANRRANSTATLTIAGTGFSTTPGNNIVTFNNGAIGTVTAATPTSLTVTLSTLPKAGNLTASVATSGVPSPFAAQVARVTPVVNSATTSLSSTNSQPIITIVGSGFDLVASRNTVAFNNGVTGTVTAATATSLTVRLNARPTAGLLTAIVTTNSVASATVGVQVARIAPTITARTATLARSANTIEINGFGFSTTAANNTVVFNNGAVGRVVAATATKLTVSFTTRPVSVGSLTARVTTNTVASGTVGVQVATMT